MRCSRPRGGVTVPKADRKGKRNGAPPSADGVTVPKAERKGKRNGAPPPQTA
ncbi:MAG: hypothetical protein IKK83_01470 [Clostridia bacterium]|nr:hypothetical protein [Clostridia bacterium]